MMKNTVIPDEDFELPELTAEEEAKIDELIFTAGGRAWWL